MLLSLNGNFVPHVTARCEELDGFCKLFAGVDCGICHSQIRYRKHKNSFEIQRVMDSSLDSCSPGDGCNVLLDDRRAILVGRINRYRIGRFAEEKLVHKAQKVSILN